MSSNQKIWFADQWFFANTSSPSTSKVFNLRITREINSVRFQGVLSQSNGVGYAGGSLIVSSYITRFLKRHIYSLGWLFKDNIGTIIKPGVFAVSANWYVERPEINNRSLYIFNPTIDTETNNGIGSLIILKAGTNVPFDFTISDVFMYEGAYTNPPLYVSLDVNPNMSILYKDRLYEKQYGGFPSVSTGATIGWQRIYEIPCVKKGINFIRTNFEGILQIGKEYNASIHSFTEVKFGVAKDGGDTYAFLEADAYGVGSVATGTTYPFSQFRISRNLTTGVFYLDGYHANSASNGVWFNLSDWSYLGRDRTWHLYEIMSNPTNNNYIKSFNEVQIGDFHYKEAIPSGIESVLTKTITLKMTKI